MENEVKRVATYTRVSTQEQSLHGLSLEAQQENLDDWAQREGVRVVGRYSDPGISARKPASKRPGLQTMLEDVRAGKIDMIVFTKLDRWFRNVAEYYKVQEVLEKYHVDWRTILEDYDTSTATGRFKINIMLSVAQDEADRTGERIKVVFDAKRARKEPLTGIVPTGYKLDGKKIAKDPNSEEAVKDFFLAYLSSGSVSVAQQAAESQGLRINYHTASGMLDNKAYYGYYYDTEDMCPPYISKTEYDKIQSMRRRVVRKVVENRVYMFSGLISCGVCGGQMCGRANRLKGSLNYNCDRSKKGGRTPCSNHVYMSEGKIEAYLMDTIDEAFAAVKTEYSKIAAKPQKRSGQKEIAALRRKLSRLKDLYLNELLTLDEYRRDRGDLTARLEALEAETKPIILPDFSRLEGVLQGDWKEMYKALDKPKKREFWRIIIRDIRIYPDRHIEYDLHF